jgi:glutamyl-tRNA synthetase
VVTGRFAPSPTGDLHLGNLRTALAAWLLARAVDGAFVVRIEDLDRATSTVAAEQVQLSDLAALGIDWDNDPAGPVWRQSARFPEYEAAIAELVAAGLAYECYCSRREISDAARAPHAPRAQLAYPGTCRDLSDAARVARRRQRPPALRFRSGDVPVDIDDLVAGAFSGRAHDVVLRRNDGVPAYNLAVVVDDAAQGVDQVVRGDDLLPVTPSQVVLQRALGLATPTYGHVPMVLGPTGRRLAKRDGAVTPAALAARGVTPGDVLDALAESLGLARLGGRAGGAAALLEQVGRGWRPPTDPVAVDTVIAALGAP